MNYIVNECVSLLVMSDSLWPHGLWPARLLCPWNSPGKNTGMGCHSLLQRSFSTQRLSPALLHCRKILYHLNYQGSPSAKWKCRAFFQNNEELQGSNSTALSQLRNYLRVRALRNCIGHKPMKLTLIKLVYLPKIAYECRVRERDLVIHLYSWECWLNFSSQL